MHIRVVHLMKKYQISAWEQRNMKIGDTTSAHLKFQLILSFLLITRAPGR